MKIIYFAHFHKNMPGVVKKIEQTVNALNEIGYDASANIVGVSGMRGHSIAFSSIFSASADVLIIRSTLFSMPFHWLAIFWQRLRGTKIVIDVPTPITNVWEETRQRAGIGRLGRWIRLLILALVYPWVLWVAHIILQYSDESPYFSLGLKDKIIKQTNGVDVDKIRERAMIPDWPASNFVLIAVANISNWHGYDRAIRGIARYVSLASDSLPKPKLLIVGDGDARDDLEDLADKLQVRKYVLFQGIKEGEELDQLFEYSHVAISSLGLYRIKLESASVLKSREYSARGIPIISAGADSDFEPLPNFVFQVGNSDDPIDVFSIIEWYDKLSASPDLTKTIRSFAQERLDLKNKLNFLRDFT